MLEGLAAEGQHSAQQALASKPRLFSMELDAWNAFSRLSSRRPVSGFGVIGSIPYGEMLPFIDDVLQIDDPDDRDTLIELIEHLDGLYLKEAYEKQEQDRKKQANKPPLRSTRR